MASFPWERGNEMRKQLGAAVLALVVLSALPGAAAEGDRDATWVRAPRPEDMLSVWPDAAMRRGQGGRATIKCKVNVQGGLFDCLVVRESPAGAGFGEAALIMAPQFMMKPALRNGQPVVSEVTIPIAFGAPGAQTGSRIPGGTSFSPDPSIPQRVLTNIPWTQAPTYAETVAAYPAKAREQGVGGRVALTCTFARTGAIGSCDVLREEPEGLGFGKAARTLARSFAGPASADDGKPVQGAVVQIAVAFDPRMLTASVPVTGRVRWAALPSGEEFAASFSAPTASIGVDEVRVLLGCTIDAHGGLQECKVDREEPGGHAFGRAALSLAPKFRVRIWSDEGLPMIGGVVHLPIRYKYRDPAPSAAKP